MTENTRLLKPDELREIAERERKATPGPWNAIGNPYGFLVSTLNGMTICEKDEATSIDFCNAEFIAASRTDIPRLLTHIEALQAQLSSLCPIGDLGVITSLQTEKTHMVEHIKAQQAEIERYKTALERICGIEPDSLYDAQLIAEEAL